MLIFLNEASKAEKVNINMVCGYVKLLSPITPHICEEMWEKLGHNNTIAYEAWPTYDPKKLVASTVSIMVQVNGKLRDKLEVSADAPKEEVEALALNSQKVKQFTDGHEIVKVIVVPKKIVNIVIK